MNILLVSSGDMCRSRIAQELLNSFGRGMKIGTAGISEGNCVPDIVCDFMGSKGYELSRRKPQPVCNINFSEWDFVVTLCKDADDELRTLSIEPQSRASLFFDDPFADSGLDEIEQQQELDSLFDDMYRKLYEFYRDTLSELLMPRCTCGANTYCRCE